MQNKSPNRQRTRRVAATVPQRIPESAILRAVMDWLAASRIFAVRMNSGTQIGSHKGKKWAIHMNAPGTADVLAFVTRRRGWFDSPSGPDYTHDCVMPFWLEIKAADGKQSEMQKGFQAQVEAEGHKYAIIRSVDQLEALLAQGAKQ